MTLNDFAFMPSGFRDKRPTTNEEYRKLVEKLKSIVLFPTLYKADHLKRVYTRGPNRKVKLFYCPSYIDRALHNLYSFMVLPFGGVYADKLGCIGLPFNAFRKYFEVVLSLGCRNHLDMVLPVFVLNVKVICCLKEIFSNWLIKNVSIFYLPIILQWLKNEFFDFIYEDRNLFCLVEPLKQKKIKRNFIFNILLNDIQKFVEESVKIQLGCKVTCNLVRFMDDIIVFCDTLKTVKKAKDSLKEFFELRGLKLDECTTTVVNLSRKGQKFSFLDLNFRYNFANRELKLRPFIPVEEVRMIKKKILKVCKIAKNTEEIIRGTNSLTFEWTNYYNFCNSKYLFARFSYWLLKIVKKAIYTLYTKSSFENGRFGIRQGKRSGRLRRKLAAKVVEVVHFLTSKFRNKYSFSNLTRNSRKLSLVLSKTPKNKVELFIPKY